MFRPSSHLLTFVIPAWQHCSLCAYFSLHMGVFFSQSASNINNSQLINDTFTFAFVNNTSLIYCYFFMKIELFYGYFHCTVQLFIFIRIRQCIAIKSLFERLFSIYVIMFQNSIVIHLKKKFNVK